MILNNHAAARVLILQVNNISLCAIQGASLVNCAREDAGQVLVLIVAGVVGVQLLRVREDVSSCFAAELHAGEWARRLVLSHGFLCGRGEVLSTSMNLLVSDSLDVGRHVDLAIGLVPMNNAPALDILGVVLHLMNEPVLVLATLESDIGGTTRAWLRVIVLYRDQILFHRVKGTGNVRLVLD